jgi:hypothetical protein
LHSRNATQTAPGQIRQTGDIRADRPATVQRGRQTREAKKKTYCLYVGKDFAITCMNGIVIQQEVRILFYGRYILTRIIMEARKKVRKWFTRKEFSCNSADINYLALQQLE